MLTPKDEAETLGEVGACVLGGGRDQGAQTRARPKAGRAVWSWGQAPG